MNARNTTVVICAAGMGTRLGIGNTKALIQIENKPLIIHQLELLKDYDDVRIVVGYQAEKVIEVVKNYRKDIMFVFNYDYKNTGTAASLSKAIKSAREYVVSMDADLLIKKSDFENFMEHNESLIAISDVTSDEPIYVNLENEKVISFDKVGEYEWPGLAKIKTELLRPYEGHTYEMLESLLPIKAIKIESRDIDTPDDYDRTCEWVKKNI